MITRIYKILLATVLITVTSSGAVHATTLSEVLEGVLDSRKPATLTSLTFLGDMTLALEADAVGLLPEEAQLLVAWRSPDDWFATYELSGELATGSPGAGAGHPAVDQVFLSRPDFMEILLVEWNAQYQGTAMWDGEPAWSLLFVTKDRTLNIPGFTMYIRKDDFYPLRTEVEFSDASMGITDLTWIDAEGVAVPATFITVFNPAIGPLAGYETTWFNHEINPDLSGMEFPRQEGSLLTSNDPTIDEGPAVFEELYHGFADDPIVAPLNDSSGTYSELSFTFSLYVEDSALIGILNDRRDEIRNLATDLISHWDWSGDNGLSTPGGKFDCGREIRDAIGELLSTDSITDFYFLDFEAQ